MLSQTRHAEHLAQDQQRHESSRLRAARSGTSDGTLRRHPALREITLMSHFAHADEARGIAEQLTGLQPGNVYLSAQHGELCGTVALSGSHAIGCVPASCYTVHRVCPGGGESSARNNWDSGR